MKKVTMDPVVETALYHICLVLNYVLTGETTKVEEILGRCQPPEKALERRVVVLVPKLRVRSGPGLSFAVVDHLSGGDEVVVKKTVTTDEVKWMKIGEERWAAMSDRGEPFAAEMEAV